MRVKGNIQPITIDNLLDVKKPKSKPKPKPTKDNPRGESEEIDYRKVKYIIHEQ
jgi:hypothetical protein